MGQGTITDNGKPRGERCGWRGEAVPLCGRAGVSTGNG